MPSIRAAVSIPAEAAAVWRALSERHGLTAWFCEHAHIALENRQLSFWGRHTITLPTADRPAGEYLSHESDRVLRFSWLVGSTETTVTVLLERGSDAGNTAVTVTHENLPPRQHEEDAAFHDFWYTALENLRMYVVSGRPQPMPDYSSTRGDSVAISVPVDAPPERVFQTISDPHELNRYFGKNARVDLRKGGEISFGWDEGGPVRILELDVPNLLSCSWEYRGEPSTTVTWTLEGSEGATTVTITHSGFGESYRTDAYNAGWFSFLAIIRSMAALGDSWAPVEIEGVGHGDV